MSDSNPAPQSYAFGEFTLDVRRAELSGPSGTISLRPQSFEVLLLLVANHGRLVTKEELHAKIWGGRAVTDDSLTQCLIDVRKAIGDSKRKIIRTVPRRGYVFAGEIISGSGGRRTGSPTTGSRAREFTILVAAALVLGFILFWLANSTESPPAPATMEHSIAVLPFVDLSIRQNDEYRGRGLAEDVLNSLAQSSELRVIARTSSFASAASSANISEIRDTLHVAYVLEGSIRRSGDQVKVVAQLIDTADSTHVWSHTYDTGLQELITVQHAITGAVLRQIVPGLQPVVTPQAAHDFSARDLIWLARRYEDEVRARPEVNRERLEQAIDLYRDATRLDPDSALAHSRLAGALLYGGIVDGARESIDRAMILDPELSEVQATLGTYYWVTNRADDAGAAWKRAIQLNPSNVDALSDYATWHWIRKDSITPERYYRRALELDRKNLSRYADLGFFLGSKSRIRATEEIARNIEEQFSDADAYLTIARLLDFSGRIDESIAWTIRARNLEPGNELHVAALAELYVDIGDYDTALALQPDPGVGLLLKMGRYHDVIDEAELLKIDEPDDTYLRYLLAFAYTSNGRPNDAVRIFEDLGMLDPSAPPPRRIIDLEAHVILASALQATDDTERAREMANWFLDETHLDSADWWIHLYESCAYAILGNDDEALDRLERVPDSPRLPWKYLVEDSRCFDRLRDNSRYQKVLERIDQRLARIREILPKTLEKFDVQL